MTRSRSDAEQTQRLRDWIDQNYSGRGMFSAMEADSTIRAQRWKDVYYKRQHATQEMLSFVHHVSTKDHLWVTSGVRPPEDDGSYPFMHSPPTPEECRTVTSRLVWVIKEFAAPKGKDLFTYLESRYRGTPTADEWASVILGKKEATNTMIENICKERRHFASWVATGDAVEQQVSPADEASIEQWMRYMNEKYPFFSTTKNKAALIHGTQED